ncbi:hypothetical protein Pure05_19610 [Paenarthrobacter ureafaciens]|nr:hypothetical protein NicSoilE8_30460 [Arthrobacter sp. NicSoilE8]GLU59549.1 hypothetical protein Pure01_20620 [Paenarthrobacter ureafaciens]GLU63716.1 hypothetical protein Pure02_19660 [Paenarthrobacter ureafaciens]GLU68091.1 hypothetical protein Pure03_20670 [Paenarthrobacter ureafaciens]GLU72252.1 hypothetical protein Pure04_19670 [Paenarthrobacter ureafaciens]
MQVQAVAYRNNVPKTPVTQRLGKPLSDGDNHVRPVLHKFDDPLYKALHAALHQASIPCEVRPGIPHFDDEGHPPEPGKNISRCQGWKAGCRRKNGVRFLTAQADRDRQDR